MVSQKFSAHQPILGLILICGFLSGCGFLGSSTSSLSGDIELLDDDQASLYNSGGTMELPVTMSKLDGTIDTTRVEVTVTEGIATNQIASFFLTQALAGGGDDDDSTPNTVEFLGLSGAVTNPDAIPFVLMYVDEDEYSIVESESDGSFSGSVVAMANQPILLIGLTGDSLDSSTGGLPTFYSYNENGIVDKQLTDMVASEIQPNAHVDANGNIYFQKDDADGGYEIWRKNPDGSDGELILSDIPSAVRYISSNTAVTHLALITSDGNVYSVDLSDASVAFTLQADTSSVTDFESLAVLVTNLGSELPENDTSNSYQIHFVGDEDNGVSGFLLRNASTPQDSSVLFFSTDASEDFTDDTLFAQSFLIPKSAASATDSSNNGSFYMIGTEDQANFSVYEVVLSDQSSFSEAFDNRTLLDDSLAPGSVAWIHGSSTEELIFATTSMGEETIQLLHYDLQTTTSRNMGSYANFDGIALAPDGSFMAACNLETVEIRATAEAFDNEDFSPISGIGSCSSSKKTIFIDADLNLHFKQIDANENAQIHIIRAEDVPYLVENVL